MKITGYTTSKGRDCHSAMPSITRSVIVEMVCLDTFAPYTSARCAQISPWVKPLADNEITRSSSPVSRRWRFLTCFRQDGFAALAVAGIAAVAAGGVVLAVAQVIVELTVERRLHDSLGQLRQQPPLTGQLQSLRAGPPAQLPHQLVIGRLPQCRLQRRRIELDRLLIIHHIGHSGLLLPQELHRKIYSPCLGTVSPMNIAAGYRS